MFKILGKLPAVLEESMEYIERCQTCNRLGLQTLGILIDYAQKSPRTLFQNNLCGLNYF